ncbi:PPA1309 family protein [Microlunatus soli]|uniref:Uncharacterized protein n=1 Tax=Microlunatus soli TaxID=630515 RepID=A0A1H1MM18_9ACTN|nr:PPA1309 family protein [Microlunatus soli]SDR87747.1 hypothetical protein SAMN04489812_0189 [Microlunatus soli]
MTENHPDDPTTIDTDQGADGSDALVAALLELERHVGQGGWDQPPRLFALVRTDAVIAAEPQLVEQLGLRGSADGGHPDALTAIEQDHFKPSADLLTDLAEIVWPEAVYGCALTLESSFLPADAEADIPDDPQAAAEYVAGHAAQQEMRVVVGVDRAEHRHGVARVRSRPDDLLGAPDLVPGLTEALAHTLVEPDLDDEPGTGQPGTVQTGTVQEK